jgi:hypothetical protein
MRISVHLVATNPAGSRATETERNRLVLYLLLGLHRTEGCAIQMQPIIQIYICVYKYLHCRSRLLQTNSVLRAAAPNMAKVVRLHCFQARAWSDAHECPPMMMNFSARDPGEVSVGRQAFRVGWWKREGWGTTSHACHAKKWGPCLVLASPAMSCLRHPLSLYLAGCGSHDLGDFGSPTCGPQWSKVKSGSLILPRMEIETQSPKACTVVTELSMWRTCSGAPLAWLVGVHMSGDNLEAEAVCSRETTSTVILKLNVICLSSLVLDLCLRNFCESSRVLIVVQAIEEGKGWCHQPLPRCSCGYVHVLGGTSETWSGKISGVLHTRYVVLT